MVVHFEGESFIIVLFYPGLDSFVVRWPCCVFILRSFRYNVVSIQVDSIQFKVVSRHHRRRFDTRRKSIREVQPKTAKIISYIPPNSLRLGEEASEDPERKIQYAAIETVESVGS